MLLWIATWSANQKGLREFLRAVGATELLQHTWHFGFARDVCVRLSYAIMFYNCWPHTALGRKQCATYHNMGLCEASRYVLSLELRRSMSICMPTYSPSMRLTTLYNQTKSSLLLGYGWPIAAPRILSLILSIPTTPHKSCTVQYWQVQYVRRGSY